MAQKQGNSSSAGGRIDGSLGSAVVAGDFTLGAGWGTTPVVAVLATSTDQRGQITITCDATAAQATATVALAFTDGDYAAIPHVECTVYSDSAITDTGHIRVATVSASGFTATLDVLPVDTKIYVIRWFVTQ